MAWFNKYYRCSQGHEWQDEWDCLCDDRCPICDESCEPYDYAEIDHQPEMDKNYALEYRMSRPFIMFIRKDYTNESDREHFPTSGEGGNNSDQRTCADHTASSSGGSEVPASSIPLVQGISEG